MAETEIKQSPARSVDQHYEEALKAFRMGFEAEGYEILRDARDRERLRYFNGAALLSAGAAIVGMLIGKHLL